MSPDIQFFFLPPASFKVTNFSGTESPFVEFGMNFGNSLPTNLW